MQTSVRNDGEAGSVYARSNGLEQILVQLLQMIDCPFKNLIGMLAQILLTQGELFELECQVLLDAHDLPDPAEVSLKPGTGPRNDEHQDFIASNEILDHRCIARQHLLNGFYSRGRHLL